MGKVGLVFRIESFFSEGEKGMIGLDWFCVVMKVFIWVSGFRYIGF